MAKVKLNPIIEQVRGQVGELVFKRYGDGVVIARKPDPTEVEPTEAQAIQRERFRQAVLYGKMVMADPDSRSLYEDAARATGKPMFSLTVADFFNEPAVEEIDLSSYGGATGDEIIIRAGDDFEVIDVQVAITDTNGAAIEAGAAVTANGRWHYTATAAVAPGTAVRITVTATDRPGGSGEAVEEVAV